MKLESGTISCGKAHFDAADSDWNLLEGAGWRVYRKLIPFKNKFAVAPSISCAFSALDILQGANTRIFCRTGNITDLGFELEIGTWYDTHVWGRQSLGLPMENKIKNYIVDPYKQRASKAEVVACIAAYATEPPIANGTVVRLRLFDGHDGIPYTYDLLVVRSLRETFHKLRTILPGAENLVGLRACFWRYKLAKCPGDTHDYGCLLQRYHNGLDVYRIDDDKN